MKNKSGLSITNGFKIVIGEGPQGGSESRKPEKIWVSELVSFTTKHLELFRKLFRVNKVLKTLPPTYRIEDVNGEIIEGKHFEQDLIKPEFDFESNQKVLESLDKDLRSSPKQVP